LAAALAGLGVGLLILRKTAWKASPRYIAAPAFLTVSAFLCLLIVGSTAGTWFLPAVTALLVGAHFAALRQAATGEEKSIGDLIQAAHVLEVAALFLLLTFLFGINSFYYVSMPTLGLAAGAAMAWLVAEMLWRGGFRPADHWLLIVISGALAFEIYVGFSFLPTGHLVNAAATAVLFVAALHVVKMVMQGAGEARYIRKELAVSLLSVAALLATARWS